MSDELHRAIGRLEGKMDMMLEEQKQTSDHVEALDGRLRSVEAKSAIYGTVGGSVMSAGISLIIASMKAKTGL